MNRTRTVTAFEIGQALQDARRALHALAVIEKHCSRVWTSGRDERCKQVLDGVSGCDATLDKVRRDLGVPDFLTIVRQRGGELIEAWEQRHRKRTA
ncbi:MAG TPA: hypothetical protein VFH61_15880 [Thermoleophilia bacterium]|nr:hypothetical protein [Thermoleophilia bacterium]